MLFAKLKSCSKRFKKIQTYSLSDSKNFSFLVIFSVCSYLKRLEKIILHEKNLKHRKIILLINFTAFLKYNAKASRQFYCFTEKMFYISSYVANYSLSRELMWRNLYGGEAVILSRLNSNLIFPKVTKNSIHFWFFVIANGEPIETFKTSL